MIDNFWDLLMEDDEHAAEYMATYGEGPGFETRHVIGSFINNGESVLDAGAGPAWNADHFYDFGPQIERYKALDYSHRFVRVANQRWGSDPLRAQLLKDKVYEFAYGDIRHLKEPSSSWDVVILQDCLEHTNGYKKAVKDALRVAKKRVIVTFWHLEGNEGNERINDDGNDGYGAWYDRGLWELFLNDLPFVWYDTEVAPEGRNHKWDFYIIDKEAI